MRVRCDHRPVEQAAEISGGAVLGDRQDPILNRFAQGRAQRSCPFGNQPRPSSVDPTRGQRLHGRRQAIAQILRLADPGTRGDRRDLQRGSDFRRRQ